MMDNSPYTIYIGNRPLRIAFLINPKDRKIGKLLEEIIVFNQTKWGGRYNPIILTDGISIDDEYWKLLSEYDPDYILGLTTVRNNLIKRIDTLLSPICFEVLKRRYIDLSADQGIRTSIDPISIYPTKDNMIEASKTIPSESPTCINLKVNNTKDIHLKRFVKYNFGSYLDLFQESHSLSYVQHKIYDVTNIDSLVETLSELSQISPHSITYPIQICSLPNYFPEVQAQTHTKMFTVIVGDSPTDISYHWNRCINLQKWKRTSINQLWLPTRFAINKKIQDVIKMWLEKVVDTVGPTSYTIQFLTFSLQDHELHNIARALLPNGFRSVVRVLNKFTFEPLTPEPPFAITSRIKDIYTIHSTDVSMSVNEPNLNLAIKNQGYWMDDIYVKLPIMYNNIRGKTYWLQLPRRNNLAHQFVKGKQARINSIGIPSILLNTNDTSLNIHLPNERYIINNLLIVPNEPSFSADVRYEHKLTEKKYYRSELSDKGMYLNGFINLFKDLS